MPIKSLDELKKIREEHMKKVELRETGQVEGDMTEILVGMATCGIAAGARETLTAILDEIENKGLKNVRVVQVGCMGYCHSEPTVQVNKPGQEPVLYGKIDGAAVKDLFEKHIEGDELLDDHILIKTFNKA